MGSGLGVADTDQDCDDGDCEEENAESESAEHDPEIEALLAKTMVRSPHVPPTKKYNPCIT